MHGTERRNNSMRGGIIRGDGNGLNSRLIRRDLGKRFNSLWLYSGGPQTSEAGRFHSHGIFKSCFHSHGIRGGAFFNHVGF